MAQRMIPRPRPVNTKADFVRRYAAGEFGNASPTWDRFEEFPTLGHLPGQLFHLRNRTAGGSTHYNLSADDLYLTWFQKSDRENWYASAMAPTPLTLFQGEVYRDVGGLRLFYSTVRKPMRDALRERAEEVSGIIAVSLLRGYLDTNSYEWLSYLLDAYHDHVIEFSTYSRCWGTIPGFNTVFWEVRKY